MATKPGGKKSDADLRPEKGIFWPAVICVVLIAVPMLLFPQQSEKLLTSVYTPFSINFGSIFLWMTVGLIFICFYFTFSRYGNIKLGEPDEKPEFSLPSWLAMIFCSGVAGDFMFWSLVEPIWDLITPPQYAAPMSTQAYDWAETYLLLHWGPNAWCTYFVTAMPLCYLFHIRRKPVLRTSAGAETILGKQVNGIIGRTCDVFFILGLLFCTSVTMCVSLPSVQKGIETVFGIPPSYGLELTVLCVSCGIATWSVMAGLRKGINNLSRVNVFIALGMVAFGAICGPTHAMFDTFTNSFGKLVNNFFNMNFWTSPFADNSFPRDWTIFYALFWFGYGPFMGLFIARISRGRTIRELVGLGLLGTCAGSYVVHAVFASYALYVQYHGIVDAASIIQTAGEPAAMMAILDSLPMGKIVILCYCSFSTIFLATSIDSGCYVISSVATRRMSINDHPARWHRAFWAVIQAFLALGILSIGGLGVAKMFGNFSGVFMAMSIILLTVSWFKILRRDGEYLLAHYVPRSCPPPKETWSDDNEDWEDDGEPKEVGAASTLEPELLPEGTGEADDDEEEADEGNSKDKRVKAIPL